MVVIDVYVSIFRFICCYLIGLNFSCWFWKLIDCLNKELLFWGNLKKDWLNGKYSEV